jgi:hypothetical protein
MILDEIKTYEDLSDYLLTKIDVADDRTSKVNPTFTKKEMWNHFMGQCIAGEYKEISIRTKDILTKNIKKDFS